MRRPSDIAKEEAAMSTLAELTSVFEGIASMRIAQIKNQVLQAGQFFHELWPIYAQLREGTYFGFGRRESEVKVLDKELYIIITAEGGFSGDIDQRLIELMLGTYSAAKNDIIVIGHHGALQLAQRNISYDKYFKLPTQDRNINVTPVVAEVQKYRSTSVFYQEYVTLMSQAARRIELSFAVQQRGKRALGGQEVISEATYIFEPSTYAVVDHLERSMMQIALSQLILESKLAQYGSRFRAMSVSHERADDVKTDLHLLYNRARRTAKDERLKEIVNGLKKTKAGVQS